MQLTVIILIINGITILRISQCKGKAFKERINVRITNHVSHVNIYASQFFFNHLNIEQRLVSHNVQKEGIWLHNAHSIYYSCVWNAMVMQ